MRREDGSDLRWRIGHEHKLSDWPRRAARWSAGVLVAKWAFGGIAATGVGAHGLFASLDQNVRDWLATVAMVPIVWPLCGLLFSLFLLNGYFVRAARLTFEGPYGAYRIDIARNARIARQARALGPGWRWWLIAGWWAMAAIAGAATTVVAGALLRNIGSAWLAWFLVLVAGWLISRAETAVTVGRYPERAVVPTGQQVDSAMVEWLVNKTLGLRPSQPGYGMALLQAFSGRDSAGIREDLTARIGKGGPFVWAGRWLGAGVAVLIYGMLPAPSVERFRDDGWIGRSFVNLQGVSSVAHDNLGAALAVGGVALALTPLAYFVSYLRFMHAYRFPRPIVRTVMRRFAPVFVMGPIFWLPAFLAGGVLFALVAWLGAAVAVHWNSPVLGAAALLLSGWILALTVEKAHRWLYTSGPFSQNIRSKPVKATPAGSVLPSPPESPQLRTLTGHTGKVNAVAVAADGSWLASGGDDATIRIWDLADGHCRTVLGHIGAVLSLALTPDGARLVSGSDDGKIRFWEVATGRMGASREGIGRSHTDPVTALAVAVAPDGNWLASGASDATVRIWDAGRRQVRAELWGAVYGLRGLAISPDSTLLAGSTGLDVVIWDVPKGEVRLRLAGHAGVVNAVAFAPDGTWLASTDTDETVRIWDTASGHLRSVLQQRRPRHSRTDLQLYGGVLSVAISPDSTWLTASGSDGQVQIWAVARGKLRATLTGHTGAVTSMALAPDGGWLATGGEDGTVRIWDLGVPAGLHRPGPHQSQHPA
jgi:WD40 repeat protein